MKQQLIEAVTKASERAFAHAKKCRDCYHPIVDAEGNPQYMSEACPEGGVILQALRDAEHAYFSQT